jgi:phosphoketolase
MKLRDPWDLLQQTGEQNFYPMQRSKDKLAEHKLYINKNSQDMPGIRNWNRSSPN